MTLTLVEILEKIRNRVRSVCQHLPDEEFNALTLKMAQLEFKYEQQPERLSSFPPDVARREGLTLPTGTSTDGQRGQTRVELERQR